MVGVVTIYEEVVGEVVTDMVCATSVVTVVATHSRLDPENTGANPPMHLQLSLEVEFAGANASVRESLERVRQAKRIAHT